MTRRRLNLILYGAIAAVSLFGVVMGWAKFWGGRDDVFDFLRDATPLVVGVAAAVLANAFQKRSAFIGFLRDEWYNIVETKTALICFCRRPEKSMDDALAAWSRISVAIDRMRILYRNVGETKELVGSYPYAPLHDMRWAIERGLCVQDPLKDSFRDPAELDTDWRQVEQRIWIAFAALREVFLEELKLQEPDFPILASMSERTKRPGAAHRKDARNVAGGAAPPAADPRAARDRGDASRDQRFSVRRSSDREG